MKILFRTKSGKLLPLDEGKMFPRGSAWNWENFNEGDPVWANDGEQDKFIFESFEDNVLILSE
jgi:hypothetical protein